MDRRPGYERAALVTVALGAILAPLSSTMIAVALPRIVDDFHTSVGTVGWLVTSYLLALAVVQPVAGSSATGTAGAGSSSAVSSCSAWHRSGRPSRPVWSS
jgi:MFS family permease